MEWLAERGHLGVVSIGGHHILNQIVGANALEIDLVQKVMNAERRRRHLNHDPHGDCFAKRQPLCSQRSLRLNQQLFNAANFLQRADHGKQQVYPPGAGRTTADGSELREE